MTIRGPKAVEVMRAIYPLMSIRRRAQIVRALAAVNLEVEPKLKL